MALWTLAMNVSIVKIKRRQKESVNIKALRSLGFTGVTE
jgi:hypothetical protein